MSLNSRRKTTSPPSRPLGYIQAKCHPHQGLQSSNVPLLKHCYLDNLFKVLKPDARKGGQTLLSEQTLLAGR